MTTTDTIKRIYILRHGKAETANPQGDFYRVLEPSGDTDVREVAAALADTGARPGSIISSAATRAVQTAQIAAELLQVDESRLFLHSSLFDGGVESWLEELYALPDSTAEVLLVGHNPVLEFLVRELSGKAMELPAGGLVMLEYEGEWQSIGALRCRWQGAHFPERYRDRLPSDN